MSESDDMVYGPASADPVGPDAVAARAAGAQGGPVIVGLLADIDATGLSRRGRIDALVAFERVKGWAEAQQQRVLAALASEADPGGTADPAGELDARLDKQWVREEVACALRIAAPTAAARLALAVELATRFPQTLDLVEAGRVSLPMARRLAESAVALDDDAAAVVQARVVGRASGQTFSQFAQAVRRAVLAADPRNAERRHTAAVAQRAVRVRPLEDGMAEMWTINTADAITAAYAALDHTAHHTGDGGEPDERTMDQRRADALIHLLTTHRCGGGRQAPDASGDSSDCGGGRSTAGRGPAVQVTVAASTLLRLDDQPGELAGYGPIPAALARAIAADPGGTWRRLVTDPTGRLVDYGRTVYRPPAALADHVRARDQTCRFPTCNRRAEHCELDHSTPWQHGGHTNAANLQSLCGRDHHVKHEAGWTAIQHRDESTEWISPTGHHYRKPAEILPVDTTTEGRHRIGNENWLDHDTGPPPF